MTPTCYRSRPVDIEAVEWRGDNVQELWDVFTAEKVYGPTEDDRNLYVLAGPDGVSGWLVVPRRHYVARHKDDNTDLWPLAPGVLDRKYGPVGDWVFSCPSCGSPSYKPWSLVTCDDDDNEGETTT